VYREPPAGLTIVAARTDADLEAMIEVRATADPDRPPPRIENLRHNLASQRALTFVVARLDERAVACGFVYADLPDYAEAHLVVVPAARRRGIGSALLAELGTLARAARKGELQGEVRESDEESRAYCERRGFRVVGGEKAVALELEAIAAPAPQPPAGIHIVSRAERPDLTDALYPVGAEAAADIPGAPGRPTYEQWRAVDVDRPTRDPELFFIALVGDQPVGYATIDNFGGPDAFHGLTAVKREWRRRGVATALKQTHIAAAKRAGFRRLVTGSEERNTPMRNLNAKLGYRPEPSLSTVVLRGPCAGRLRRDGEPRRPVVVAVVVQPVTARIGGAPLHGRDLGELPVAQMLDPAAIRRHPLPFDLAGGLARTDEDDGAVGKQPRRLVRPA
jgi:mycothiol synthase